MNASYYSREELHSLGLERVGCDVLISRKTSTIILPGVTVNEGVAVGAHSLITKDCASWSVCTFLFSGCSRCLVAGVDQRYE